MITGLCRSQGHSKSISLFLNDKFAFKLEAEVVLKEGLQVGQELSVQQVEALKKKDLYQKCLDTALRYLDYRPRSEYEVIQRLMERGFNDNDIKGVLDYLKKQGFLDDSSFAKFWKDSRQSFKPRSRRLTEIELRQKGVSMEIIEMEVSTIDDTENAYRAAANRSRNLASIDYKGFYRRLGEFLKRRGFGYEVINTTIIRLWQEREGDRIDD